MVVGRRDSVSRKWPISLLLGHPKIQLPETLRRQAPPPIREFAIESSQFSLNQEVSGRIQFRGGIEVVGGAG